MAAKTVVFFNNKGGVGKTTLTCNVVSYLNMHFGKRVLLIDADPQCNASQAMLSDNLLNKIYWEAGGTKKTLFSYLKPLERGDPAINTDVVPIAASENKFDTDIIPGHPEMSLVEDKLSHAWASLQGAEPVRGYRITNWVSQLLENVKDKYDLIIFDMGPSLGAINRTILLHCDYVVTPFGSDIFSLLGIKNISTWISAWSEDYKFAVENIRRRDAGALTEYPGIQSVDERYRLGGYSVQQYVMRRFKDGLRPVRAYDKIMQEIPSTVSERLGKLFPPGATVESLELGHIPFLYSLVPLAQSHRVPIHQLAKAKVVAGNQVGQVSEYSTLMKLVCDRLLKNIGSPSVDGEI